MRCVTAHYASQVPTNPVAALTEWLAWVAEHMGKETHLAGYFKHPAAGLKCGRAYRSGKSRRKKLDAELARGNIVELELTLMTKPEGYIAFEYEWAAVVNVTLDRLGPFCALAWETAVRQRDASLPGVVDILDAYGRLTRCMMQTRYGFAAIMPQRFMPMGYAYGLACGGAPTEFVYDANSWTRYGRKECDRVLRNVFGYNILNRDHLDIDVGGQRLEDWIRSSGDKGRLEPVEGDLFTWTFKGDDDNDSFLHWDYPPVVAVRRQLSERKLFPWQHLPGVT